MTQDGTEPTSEPKTRAEWVRLWSDAETKLERRAIRRRLPAASIESMDCTFIAHPVDNYTEFRLWITGNPPEHVAMQALCDALAGRGPVIVDVGANAGVFFIPIHVAGGPGTRSIVFEPNPTMLTRLRTNVDLNGLEPAVQIFECAISDHSGRSDMHFPRNANLGQGRIDVPYPHKRVPDSFEVPVRPLRECLAEAGVTKIDLLKVDVEGLEDRVIFPMLEAGDHLLPRMIYFETAHDRVWFYPLEEKLAQCGYKLVEQYDANALFERVA